tara:strand:- start:763 stop:957 length:195 start_codon:yes stop_codon:yes gene_type:complete
MSKIILCISAIFLLVGCANKQVLVGKKCFVDQDENVVTTTKSYIWIVDKNKTWKKQLTKENCEE